MSYRSEALHAFDAMTDDEWIWFAPRKHSHRNRDLFREFIRDGQVDAQAVLENIQVARRRSDLYAQSVDLLRDEVPMPVSRKGTGNKPALQVVV